jgi:hypothetical protein
MMKTFGLALVLAATLALGSGGTAAAGPTCSAFVGLDVANHGQHVLRDYVLTGTVAGGAPSHRGSGHAQPGASFCIDQAQSRPVQAP